jgi:hypothetical protein
MSRGKYSPNLPRGKEFIYNCYGQPPMPWNKALADVGATYDELTMFANYDDEGFDSYGYSVFDRFGTYSGIGGGVDRNGYTEYEYLFMTDEKWEDVQWNLTINSEPDTIHVLTLKQEKEMAKETKAQRDARFDAEREARLAKQVAEYPARLMAVLARATNAYFELTVHDNKFQVAYRDGNGYNETYSLKMAYAHSPNSQEQLEELEWKLDRHEQELAEKKRLAEVKAEALRKVNELFTAEERELLNL